MVAIPQPETTLAAIERAVEQEAQTGLRAHLGASLIGHECERHLWYSFRWTVAQSHTGRMLRLFARGEREEAVFVDLLRKAGVEVWEKDETGKQFRVSALGGHFGGSLDGVAIGLVEAPEKPHVLEMKTHNQRSFTDLVKKGVEKAKPQHWVQVQCYLHLMDIDRALYLAVNKNDDSLYVERIRASAGVANQALKKAERIIASDRPPARVSDDPTYYACGYCTHKALCHWDGPALANCRTCLHATPEMDGNGRWSCARHKMDIDESVQRIGCSWHLFIPDLMRNWAEQVDTEGDAVMYVNKLTGARFANGRGDVSYSSKEIAAAEDVRLIGADLTERLRKEFGGRVVG
jgi:hypothetical protein